MPTASCSENTPRQASTTKKPRNTERDVAVLPRQLFGAELAIGNEKNPSPLRTLLRKHRIGCVCTAVSISNRNPDRRRRRLGYSDNRFGSEPPVSLARNQSRRGRSQQERGCR